jgi:hypothetical protein
MGAEPTVPPFSVKPEVVALEELFEEIKRGQLRSPRFQRAFVWKPEAMRRLFESVIKGYPIGSLLIWEPGVRYECLSHFGPIAQDEPRPDRTDLAYILDGQHRLATLFGATHVEGPPPVDTVNRHWWMWFDLEAEEFTHAPRGGVQPYHLPLHDLLGTTQFLRFCSNLLTMRPSDGPALVERAERLLRLVRVYKIPVVRIRGGKLEDAVDIFSRLNSTGVPMAADQMVSALTYREGPDSFDLASRISEILEDLGQLSFAGIDRSAVLRAIAGVAGIKIHGRPGQQVANFLLGDRFTPESREQLVQRASTGLIDAARWLDGQGVRCARLLPYTLQIVMLAQFFSERMATETEALVLRRWLFATSFSGWYAGGNTTQVNDDLAEMDRFKQHTSHSFVALRERAKPFPERFDLRSARVRAFLLATLVRKAPLRRVGEWVNVVSLFPSDDVASVPKVFPRAPPPIVSAPANRILLPTVDGRSPRRQLLDLPMNERPEVLASHCIDNAGWEALQADDAAAFVRTRTGHLIAVERELMHALALEPPERETEDAPLDADA